MGKRLLIAALWGLAVWTWLSMAALLFSMPDIGPVAGYVVAMGIVVRGLASHLKLAQPTRHPANNPR